jgi:hypothetical protein
VAQHHLIHGNPRLARHARICTLPLGYNTPPCIRAPAIVYSSEGWEDGEGRGVCEGQSHTKKSGFVQQTKSQSQAAGKICALSLAFLAIAEIEKITCHLLSTSGSPAGDCV